GCNVLGRLFPQAVPRNPLPVLRFQTRVAILYPSGEPHGPPRDQRTGAAEHAGRAVPPGRSADARAPEHAGTPELARAPGLPGPPRQAGRADDHPGPAVAAGRAPRPAADA